MLDWKHTDIDGFPEQGKPIITFSRLLHDKYEDGLNVDDSGTYYRISGKDTLYKEWAYINIPSEKK